MSVGFKLLAYLLPFLREMLLGDKTIKYALKTNKIRLLVFFFFVACAAWTIYSIPNFLRVTYDLVTLRAEYTALEKKKGMLPNPAPSGGKTVVSEPHVELVKPSKPVPVPETLPPLAVPVVSPHAVVFVPAPPAHSEAWVKRQQAYMAALAAMKQHEAQNAED